MDITPEPPKNIVALNAACASSLEITHKKQEQRFKCTGRHRDVEVDSELRTMTCRTCGFVIDPFDYVEAWAIEGERRMEELQRFEIMIKIARAEEFDLMKKVKALRSKLRKVGQPQTLEERNHFDRMRWNPTKAIYELEKDAG